MTCRCGKRCQGRLCKQCEIEEANEHLADEIANESRWDSDDSGDDDA